MPLNMKKKSLTRREVLKGASAETLSALAASYPRAVWGDGAPSPEMYGPGANPKPTADAVIVLWMAGGMAHTETFDPKKYTEFRPGLESKAVLSTFPTIDSVVDNVKLS